VTECPTCGGEGGLDVTPYGWIVCPDCAGDRVVTEDLARDIRAVDVTRVDQALALYEERKRLGIA